jgi:hypothetical protein
MTAIFCRIACLSASMFSALCLAPGCAQTGGYDRDAGRRAPELRGLLLPAPPDAPPGVVAVLQSTGGTRALCYLRAVDDAVAGDIQAFAAKGAVVIVSGTPGENAFTVREVRPEGLRRKTQENQAEKERYSIPWSLVTWGRVPARDE